LESQRAPAGAVDDHFQHRLDSGLGEAMVSYLAAEGAAVVVHGGDEARTKTVAERITAAGGRADVAIGDLATEDGADSVAGAALAGGPVDIGAA
jgi:3-oxoacyl-[acyl-carrier protein] reductase